MDNWIYWVAMQQIPGIGIKYLQKLLLHFGDIEKIWHTSESQLNKLSIIPKNLVNALVSFRAETNLKVLSQKINQSGCWVITWDQEAYPELLREIYNPPIVIYGLGDKTVLKSSTIAIVGSRKPSYYGQEQARIISADLAINNLTVVSGMAKGIDAFAHQGALSKEGKTIGVLGCGVDQIYPKENSKLYYKIISSGAIISEYSPGTKPLPNYFPARNRIISGLSLGTVVIEAGEKSGALITADFAIEQGREVFALPGLVTNPNAKGTHGLIKQGAKLLENAQDIIEELYPGRLFCGNFGKSKGEEPLSKNEMLILEMLNKEHLNIEDIALLTKIPVKELNTILLELELKGIITQLPGKIFTITIE
ncbi:MAG: DNA-processing protein DprA [Bacillota bacterium]|nr:DNA-processing protein DprA [Bacillota bacterium]